MNRTSLAGATRLALDRAASACFALGVGLLALLSVLIVLQVACRNLFDLGLPWADELARFSGLSLVFLAAPALALRRRHVAVDIVPGLLRGQAERAVQIAGELAVLLFCGITLYGFQSFLSRAAGFATPAIGIPNWLFYAPALTGFVLLALVTAARIHSLLSGDEFSDRTAS